MFFGNSNNFRPHILFDGDSGGAGGGSGTTNSGSSSTGTGTGGASGDGSGGEEKRTFTQIELNALFAERAKQAKQSGLAELLKDLGAESVEAIKATLKTAKDAEAAQMSELQKAQAEAADWKAKHETAEKEKADVAAQAAEKLLRAAVLAEAAKQGFNDPGDAWLYVDRAKIMIKDDSFEGLDKAVEAVAKAKPYLVKAATAGDGRGTPNREKQKPPQQQGSPTETERRSVINF